MPLEILLQRVGVVAGALYEVILRLPSLWVDCRFFIKDPRSSSEAQSLKPEWWFLLSRVEQKAAMKKIDSFLPNYTRPRVRKISERWPRQV
jgi:hypothetical protein